MYIVSLLIWLTCCIVDRYMFWEKFSVCWVVPDFKILAVFKSILSNTCTNIKTWPALQWLPYSDLFYLSISLSVYSVSFAWSIFPYNHNGLVRYIFTGESRSRSAVTPSVCPSVPKSCHRNSSETTDPIIMKLGM